MVERASRMTMETVRDLAGTMKRSPDRLLALLREAGLPHASETELVTKEQKAILLRHITAKSGGSSAARSGQPASTTTQRPSPQSPPRRTLSVGGTTTGRASKARSSNVTVKTKGRKILVNRPGPQAEPPAGAESAAQASAEPAAEQGAQPVEQASAVAMRSEIERIREQEESRKRAVGEKREALEAQKEAERQRQEAAQEAERQAQAQSQASATEEESVKAEQEAQRAKQTEEDTKRGKDPEQKPEVDTSSPDQERGKDKKARAGRSPKGRGGQAGTSTERIVDSQREAAAAERTPAGKRRGKHQEAAPAVLEDDEFGDGKRRHREISLSGGASRARRARRPVKHVSQQGGEFQQPTAAVVREVELPETITVGELAQRMSMKAGELVKILMDLGAVATINQMLDQDTAQLVVEEAGHKVKLVQEDDIERELDDLLEVEGEQLPRSPVVTVMGHVDHGKTSLLDRIRNARVAAGEAGGITQHIGAYSVESQHGSITFIDTPGHAAYSAMRARGAGVTDIVVLVVAADDGVMPQTEEAVQHAQAAEVPVVVAINKMDLEGANPDQIRNELASRGLAPEDWGGETQYVQVSAATGEGIDTLLEAISLRAELLELTAVKDAPARGTVVESRLERGRGPVATLLVGNGQLRRGDIVIAGECTGRVRQLVDDRMQTVSTAGPSMPVEVLGLSGTPEAGVDFLVVESERRAREIAEFRFKRTAEQRAARQQAARMDVLSNLKAGERVLLGVLVKADVRGSLEAVLGALTQLGNDEVGVKIIGSGVGAINESDITLAMASSAVILGFNVKMEARAKSLKDREGVDVLYYSVIYELVDEVRGMLSKLLAPEVKESVLGTAEVREIYDSPKFGQIAGCLVVDGTVMRNKSVRLLRDDRILFTSQLNSLRRFKEDVAEVVSGTECGIGVMDFKELQVGDRIEVFEEVAVAREL